MLEAIGALVDFFESRRNPTSGAIPAEQNARSKGELMWPQSNLSLAVDLIPEVIARVEPTEWCERVERWADTMLDVYPRKGENHLDDLMELVSGMEIHSVHLQEGRFDEYFREITRGIAA